MHKIPGHHYNPTIPSVTTKDSLFVVVTEIVWFI